MGATFTASTRLEKTTNKNMYSRRGNTATYHDTTCACRCGIAAFLFFVFRGIAANVFAALPLLFCCGIAANVFAALPFVFRGIAARAAYAILQCFCSRHSRNVLRHLSLK